MVELFKNLQINANLYTKKVIEIKIPLMTESLLDVINPNFLDNKEKFKIKNDILILEIW